MIMVPFLVTGGLVLFLNQILTITPGENLVLFSVLFFQYKKEYSEIVKKSW